MDGQPDFACGSASRGASGGELHSDSTAAKQRNRYSFVGGGALRLRDERRVSGRSVSSKFTSCSFAFAVVGFASRRIVLLGCNGVSLETAEGIEACLCLRLFAVYRGFAQCVLPHCCGLLPASPRWTVLSC